MSCFVSHTTIDCHDAYALSEWWKQVLGYADLEDDPNGPGHEECLVRDPVTGHQLLFLEVPDVELPAKRIHLDLAARDGGLRDDEVERLRGLGAVEVADHRGKYGPGTGWVTFADPEGNQFCVVRNDTERAAGTTS